MRIKKIFTCVLLFIALGLPSKLNAQIKIAYINSSELTEAMPETTIAIKTLEEFQKQKQLLLENMDAERKKKYDLYEDTYKNISQANREVLEKKLAELEKEIQDLSERIANTEQQARQEIAEKEQSLYEPIVSKASKAIQAVAKEKGYSYVVDTSQPGVVYFEGGDDLQSAVRIKLGISLNAGQNPTSNK